MRVPFGSSIDESALRNHFASFGPTKGVAFIAKKGIAYVEMKTKAGAAAAVNAPSHVCNGGTLQVSWDFKGGQGEYRAPAGNDSSAVEAAKAEAKLGQVSRTEAKINQILGKSSKAALRKHSTSEMISMKEMAMKKAREAKAKRTEKRLQEIAHRDDGKKGKASKEGILAKKKKAKLEEGEKCRSIVHAFWCWWRRCRCLPCRFNGSAHICRRFVSNELHRLMHPAKLQLQRPMNL